MGVPLRMARRLLRNDGGVSGISDVVWVPGPFQGVGSRILPDAVMAGLVSVSGLRVPTM